MSDTMLERMKKFKKIDAHSHIGNFGGWAGVRMTAEELIAQMDEYNFEKAVISTFPADESIAAVDKYPQRFVGAVWVNPWDGAKALDQIRSAVEDHGFRAVKLHPLSQAYLPNDECVFPVARLARELDIPLMIHTGHPPFSLPWSVAQLAEMYPDVRMVMIHMGHGNGMYIQSAIDMAKKYPNLYLETSGMPMHNKIKEGYDTVGPDRIMFGIDAPFHHPTVELQRTLVSGLTDGQLEDVFYNNVKKLLKL
ncbi:amidohydrolase family protein [Bacilliculturomica massiliensis]|uniref:amidohydrolase family protein n=1 Tax=Bacilliculturomica massiliensis TaxID=1917867 RepID=UPI001FE7C2D7|nr:amidohydrolase family protein [Bacilliculturomica massiliensis]